MSEKKNTVDSLLEKGKATGKLTTKEITDALEELAIISKLLTTTQLTQI